MIKTTVPLLSGMEVEIRRLGMFELDDIPKDIPPAYTVSILFANGEVYQQQVDLATPRRKPTVPLEMCEKGSSDYYDWREYHTWQAGLLHAQEQYEAYCRYCEKIAEYIRETCVITDVPSNEIVAEDWERIYKAALCPQVTMEDITAAMRLNFPV